MAFREVSNQSWGGRLMGSVVGALAGGVLFLVAFPVLWWNEGRAVQTERSLEEGSKSVVSVEADKVESANEGKLVHVTAKATTDETPADPDFGVKAPKSIRLVRKAEMYQYKEVAETKTQKKLGGGEETVTTYTYPEGWYDEFHDSSTFHDPDFKGKNPAKMPFKGETWQAKKVTAGAYELPTELVSDIKGGKELPVLGGTVSTDKDAPKNPDKDDKPAAKDAPKPPEKGGSHIKVLGDVVTADKDPAKAPQGEAPTAPAGFKVVDGQFYKGADPNSPVIGDMRVSYEVVEPATVSVIARQSGASFAPYQAKAGDKIEMLDMGDRDAGAMFTEAQENNKTLTWILRLVGFAMMAIGLFLVMKPLSVLGDVVPFIGNMVGALLAVIAGVIALALSLITISIAWLAFRPLIGVPLLAAGIGAIVLVFFLARRRRVPAAETGM